MLKLPPIDSNKKSEQKKSLHAKYEEEGNLLNNVDSKIFRNGTTWFELDRIPDLCQKNRRHLLMDKCKTYLGCKNMFGGQSFPSTLYDFDDMKIQKSLYREHDPEIRTRAYEKIMKINQKQESLKEQWKYIENEEVTFKQLVQSYDKFIRLNEEKRISSRRKFEYYKERNKDMNVKITDIKEKNEYLRKIHGAIAEECKKYTHYQAFCSRAAKLEGYGNAYEFLLRYLSLRDTKEVVSMRNTEKTIQLINQMSRLNIDRLEKLDLIESLSAEGSQQKEKYRNAKSYVTHRSQILSLIQEETLMRLKKGVQTFFGVLNFYNLVRNRNFDSKWIPLRHYGQQISYIHTSMKCIEKINRKDVISEEREEEEKVSSVEDDLNIVYSLNIPEEEEKREETSKTRLEEILKSINAIQNWARLDHGPHEDPTISSEVYVELGSGKKKAKFSKSISDFEEAQVETKISDMNKLTDSIRKYSRFIETSYLHDTWHPVTRNTSQEFKEPTIIRTPKDKSVLHTSTIKQGGKSDVVNSKQRRKSSTNLRKSSINLRKSSTNLRKSIESSFTNMELSHIRKHSHRYSMTRDMLKYQSNKFFINDDGTVTIFTSS